MWRLGACLQMSTVSLVVPAIYGECSRHECSLHRGLFPLSLSPVLIGCMRTMSPKSKLNLIIRNIIVVSCNHWKRCKTRSTDHVCCSCFRLQFLYFAIVHRFASHFSVVPDVTNSHKYDVQPLSQPECPQDRSVQFPLNERNISYNIQFTTS